MSYTTLISCADTFTKLDNPGWRFFDCRFDLMNPDSGRQQFLAGHLPNAHYVHLDEDLSSPVTPTSGRHPLPDINELADKLSRWGVSSNTQVIAYDGGNGVSASRLWWLLRWLGHNEVAVMDGGFARWSALKLPISTELTQPVAAQFVPHVQNDWVVDVDQIEQQRLSGDILLDARSAERFRGEVEPIDPIAGHIPSALNYPQGDNINSDGLFRDPEFLRKQITAVIGKHDANQVIHYCGSGVSACHNILAMEYAGLPGSKLYPGSWSEWIKDPNREVETN